MKLTLDDFSGMVPVLDGHSLPDSGAQTALNCTTESHKVKLRTNVPAWSAAGSLTSDVNGREYEIDNGILKEDGVSMHMGKPATVTLERVDFWTLLRGYTGKTNSPRFQLKSVVGVAGTPSTLEISKFSYDEDTSNFIMQFIQPGGYYDAGAIAVNMASSDNVSLLYNGQEYPLQYPFQISIPDNDNGVYATVYVESVAFTTTAPEESQSAGATLQVDTANIFVRGKLIKNKSRRNYVVTYWDGRHESPPSDVSEEIDVCKGDVVKVTVSTYTGGHGTHTPDTADNAPAYYIYRTGGSLSSAGYYFVDEIASPGVYEDTKPDYLLQEKLDIVESPLEGMSFLHFFNRSLVAAKGNHVYFSEPNLLYNWPSKYEYSFADDVTGLTVSGNTVIVFVDGHSPSILRGTNPGSLVQTEVADGFECASADTICTVAGSTYYACADGLVRITESGEYRLITSNFFSRAQWAALSPSTMKCAADNFGIRLYLAGGDIYIFDFRSDGMVLTRYNAGSTFTWKTKIFTFPVPVCFRMVRATTADGTGTFTVYAGHDLENTVTTVCSYRNGRCVRLRPNIFAREWCFQVESSSDLLEIEAAESPAELY